MKGDYLNIMIEAKEWIIYGAVLIIFTTMGAAIERKIGGIVGFFTGTIAIILMILLSIL